MVRELFSDVAMLARISCGLRGFLREPIGLQEAFAIVKQRMETRPERFLDLVRRAIFQNPGSPYLRLMQAAGCELGDVEDAVARHGVDATLGRLADAGVYVTLDEFKGCKEAVRGRQRFVFRGAEFDNPLVRPHFELRSGASRSQGTAVRMSLPFVADSAVNTAVALDANGLSQHAPAYWSLSSAMLQSLRMGKLGRPPVAWFFPLPALPARIRVAANCLALLGRASGCPMPRPVLLDLQEPGRMAAWLAAQVQSGRRICMTCYASSVARICAAANAEGIPLDGVCFVALGEPFTEAKQRLVALAGARAVVHYGFTEGGLVAYSCARGNAPDDLHFFSDAFALVQRPRKVGKHGVTIEAFLITSLLSTAPKILINMEVGDHGTVEQRACGCGLGAAGLHKHISHVRSYEKLLGEGMTFLRTDLQHLLESVLPARFGGTLADYQVVEHEDAKGVLRLFVIVSPHVGAVDEARLRQTFLGGLESLGGAAQIGAAVWRYANTIQIRRQQPIPTKAGKILPLHLLKGGAGLDATPGASCF
jgi:hypothetical protein